MASPFFVEYANDLFPARGLGPRRLCLAGEAHRWEHRPERYADSQAHRAYNQRPVINHGFQGLLIGQAQVTGASWQ